MSFYDLRDAFFEPGCAACRLRDDAADRFVSSLLWESVNDPAKRDEIRRAHGFCREHAWSLVRIGASLGVAIIARDVLQDLMRDMERGAFQTQAQLSLRRVREALISRVPSAATGALVSRLTPQSACPACQWVGQMEDVILDTLTQNLLGADGLLEAFERSDGLCLPHLRQALARVRDEATCEALLAGQRAIWQRLVDQLSESIRKSDYRFKDEVWGDESGSWIRAIAALVGTRPGGQGD